ncbi:MAG TPA: 16S rRNA (adenine(1518)-N(6)/adenine(1519)-N(6))-dimethyltransferase RsmA [Bacteroidales bacterium]|nr:16S rRNA (adenine(1518)-N(6)/adenine(1519)-N(6))-dimethyltransferase RsmA [Bacteroidales bacterium]
MKKNFPTNPEYVRPKKSLGQHFLADDNIAHKITDSLTLRDQVLEIGPGTGVLTKFLMGNVQQLKVIEIDRQSVAWLHEHYASLGDNIIEGDFLKTDLSTIFPGEYSIIGNFPYNISSQIFFRVLQYRSQIPQVVGMIQKEVAERLAAPPGNKTYGIMTVLLGAFYDIEYLFTVNETVFIPPPRVKSAVIRFNRKKDFVLGCDEKLFFEVVKTSFNQRRKTLRNSLRGIWTGHLDAAEHDIFTKRPEQLNLEEFVMLTRMLTKEK